MPLVPPYIDSLQPYKAGKPIDEVKRELGLTDIIKLASNENPLGPSPLALEEMKRFTSQLHYYPNGGYDLRVMLSKLYGVRIENVITGSGSEGIMLNIIRTFLSDEDEVLTTEAAFIGFQVLAHSRGVPYVTVPYLNWRYDLPGIAERITEKTKLIYLANPNNPTGSMVTKAEFEDFYRQVPRSAIIIMDEAYFEFAEGNPSYPDSMRYRYDNVITLRTFSKVYGLAGIRIGYGFAHEDLIGPMLKVKLPFEPSTLAQAAAMGALRDHDFLARSVRLNKEGRTFLTGALRSLRLEVVPSEANFVMVVLKTERDVDIIFHGLLRQGVIIRPLKAFGLPNCLRITVGTKDENGRLIEGLKTVLSKTPL